MKGSPASAPDTSAKPLLRAGDQLGKYVVDHCIGIGGMGEVYLVRDLLTQTPFALKLIKPAVLRTNPVFGDRFLREARLASRFLHPGSIAVCDAELDASSGFLYMIMEYVDGQTLEQILADGPIPELQALEIIRNVAETLDAASEFGLVHRDIKPGNIMISRTGQVKLADLGVAKSADSDIGAALTVDNLMIGTAAYAAPEQLQNAHLADVRSDIYSLGATLFEMLTGSVPFDGETVFETMGHVLSDPLPDPRKSNPRLSDGTVALLQSMLAKKPDDRPANAAALIRLLNPLIAELKIKTPELQSLIRDRAEREIVHRQSTMTTQLSRQLRHVRLRYGAIASGVLVLWIILLLWSGYSSGQLAKLKQQTAAADARLAELKQSVPERKGRLNKLQSETAQWIARQNAVTEEFEKMRKSLSDDQPRNQSLGELLTLTVAQLESSEKFVLQWKGAEEQIEKSIQVNLPGGEEIELVWCPSGEFPMGTPVIESGRRSDERIHRVTLTRPFWIGRYEVTQLQYIALMDRNPTSENNVGLRNPVEVNWFDAVEFCRRLNEREMLAGRLPRGYVYALPTEAHWEFACRAGKPGKLGGVPSLAACAITGQDVFGKIGMKRPNSWAIFDMFGNAAEWVMDRYSAYPEKDLVDPVPRKEGGELRVVRGGSSASPANDCRAGARRSLPPDKAQMTGFRVALIPEKMVKYDYK